MPTAAHGLPRESLSVPFGTIAAAGWASGLNLYGTALLLGLAGRFDWADTPEELQRPWVLGVLAALYAVEFVIDKVPWLDSAWDAVHTVVRPIGGALLGVSLVGDAGSSAALAALLGGGFSLSAHGAKASTRAAINTSPEPITNVVASFTEDGIVAGMVTLALVSPTAAGVVAVVLAVVSLAVTWLFVRAVGKVIARWRKRGRSRPPA
jgi:hypothetical protein